MPNQMLNTNQEKSALMFFAKEGMTEDYKRMLCYVVWHRLIQQTEDKSVLIDSFMDKTADLMMVERQDVKAALAALKSPQFRAISVWNRRGSGATLVKANRTDNLATWLEAVNEEYPYFKEMVS